MNNKERFSKIVRDIIENTRLSQKEFSKVSGISIGSIFNMLNVENEKFASPSMLRKLAMMAKDNRADIYMELMQIAGHDIAKYPFDSNNEVSISKFLRESDLKLIINKAMNTMGYIGIHEPTVASNHYFSMKRDLLFEIKNKKESLNWYFDCYTDIVDVEFFLKRYIFDILRCDEIKAKTKFTIVTTNSDVAKYAQSLNLGVFNILLSVVTVENENKFEEIILKTGIEEPPYIELITAEVEK